MASNFRGLIIAFLLVGLFFFAMISFGVQINEDNDANTSITNIPFINSTYTSLQTNLSSSSTTSQSQREGFESEIPTEGVDNILLFSIVSIGKVFGSMLTGLFNVIVIGSSQALGINPIIIGVIQSILLLTLIIFIWKTIKQGE